MRMYCRIYKHAGQGCTNNGISDKGDDCIVIWNESAPDILKNKPNHEIIFVLVERHVKNNTVAIPLEQYINEYEKNGKTKWCMFGGNFVYTSDSRFPTNHPIKIHDRYED